MPCSGCCWQVTGSEKCIKSPPYRFFGTAVLLCKMNCCLRYTLVGNAGDSVPYIDIFHRVNNNFPH